MVKRIGIATLLLMLISTPIAQAHEGHSHARTMGTVSALEPDHLVVQTTDGESVSLRLDEHTKYRNGDQPATATDLKVGDRVVVETSDHADSLTASEVRFSHGAK